MGYTDEGWGEFPTYTGIFMTSIFIGYIGVMIRGWWKGIVLYVFGFIMLWKMHIYIDG